MSGIEDVVPNVAGVHAVTAASVKHLRRGDMRVPKPGGR